jgi:hypothetical protein
VYARGRAAEIMERDHDAIAALVARESGGILPKGQHEAREAAAILHAAAALSLSPRGAVLSNPVVRIYSIATVDAHAKPMWRERAIGARSGANAAQYRTELVLPASDGSISLMIEDHFCAPHTPTSGCSQTYR